MEPLQSALETVREDPGLAAKIAPWVKAVQKKAPKAGDWTAVCEINTIRYMVETDPIIAVAYRDYKLVAQVDPPALILKWKGKEASLESIEEFQDALRCFFHDVKRMRDMIGVAFYTLEPLKEPCDILGFKPVVMQLENKVLMQNGSEFALFEHGKKVQAEYLCGEPMDTPVDGTLRSPMSRIYPIFINMKSIRELQNAAARKRLKPVIAIVNNHPTQTNKGHLIRAAERSTRGLQNQINNRPLAPIFSDDPFGDLRQRCKGLDDDCVRGSTERRPWESTSSRRRIRLAEREWRDKDASHACSDWTPLGDGHTFQRMPVNDLDRENLEHVMRHWRIAVYDVVGPPGASKQREQKIQYKGNADSRAKTIAQYQAAERQIYTRLAKQLMLRCAHKTLQGGLGYKQTLPRVIWPRTAILAKEAEEMFKGARGAKLDLSDTDPWKASAIAYILFFGSILLHEAQTELPSLLDIQEQASVTTYTVQDLAILRNLGLGGNIMRQLIGRTIGAPAEEIVYEPFGSAKAAPPCEVAPDPREEGESPESQSHEDTQ